MGKATVKIGGGMEASWVERRATCDNKDDVVIRRSFSDGCQYGALYRQSCTQVVFFVYFLSARSCAW